MPVTLPRMSLTADTTLALPAATPFAFSRSVSFLDRFAPCADGQVCRRGELVTGGFAPEPFVAHLAPDGPDAVRAHVDWLDDPGDGVAVADHVDSFLSLSDDPSPLYETAESDEAFAPVASELRGYHHVRFPTPFEAACWAALSRRAPARVAAERRAALVRELGRTAVVDGAAMSLFPTPKAVRASPDAVRAAVARERESETVLAAAETFREADLRELGTDDLRERLESVRGFDPRSAAFVALRGFGRASVLPADDAGLRAAVGDVYDVDDPSEEEVRRLAEPYGEYRGYWAHYLRARDLLGDG